MIKHLEETYKGLEVRDIMRGNAPIFFHALMNAPGKESDKKALLETTVHKICDCDADDLYVDLAVTCIRKEDAEQKILTGVPPVRIYF